MKKFISIILVLCLMVFSLAGCTNKNTTDDKNNTTGNGTTNNSDTNNSDQLEDVKGRITEINEDSVKVTADGKTKTYKISGDKLKDYYIGQNIILSADKNNQYDIKDNDKYDYDNLVNDAGDAVKRVTAKVGDISEDFISFISGKDTIKVKNPGNFNLAADSTAIVDYVEKDGNNEIVKYYDEGTKLDLTIQKINRDDSGRMVIEATNANDKQYEITVDSDVVVGESILSYKVGEQIKVYPTSMTDGTPTKVKAAMIMRDK